MIEEVLLNVLNLNIGFFLNLTLSNLHWLFAFACLVKIQNPEKPWIRGTFVFILFMFTMPEVIKMLGWIPMPILSPLFFYGILILTVRIFIANTKLERWTFPLTAGLVFLTSGMANYLMT
ncbi:MAG: hypothetical protein Q7S92_05485 [Candidatus Diapherotrites archaeon]|nr:hypothetical protein [Candidatus Diapherotrites archaeon]